VDLGAGPGFFTLPAARLVGAGGHVYAVDVEPAMLDRCRRRAAKAGLTGIETVHSAETQIPLPDATADRVLIAFVLHEADDVAALLREAARLLRPGGAIAVAEWRTADGTPGPPLDLRIGEDDLAGFAAQVGLRPVPTDHRSEHYYLARLSRSRRRSRGAISRRTLIVPSPRCRPIGPSAGGGVSDQPLPPLDRLWSRRSRSRTSHCCGDT
jgi:SAM-dependent methyltransferase